LKPIARKGRRRKVFQTSKQRGKCNHWLRFCTPVQDESLLAVLESHINVLVTVIWLLSFTSPGICMPKPFNVPPIRICNLLPRKYEEKY
jgi:hypothetical protein